MELYFWLSISLQEERGNPRELFSPAYLKTTLMVWVLWFGTALSYYGMVLASAEILQLKNEEKTGNILELHHKKSSFLVQ